MRLILAPDDDRWNKYLHKMPREKQDIYYTAEYYAMHNTSKCKALMFVYEDNKENIGLYPFLLQEIELLKGNIQYYDIETAYGYGGPLLSTNDLEFRTIFESTFLDYCAEMNIVAEFIRFHPLIGNHNVFKHDIQVLHNRYTVVLDLTKELDEIWMNQISTKNRNVIRKCIKNGVVIEKSDDYNEFWEIYQQTMQKVSATSFYYFNQQYRDAVEKNEFMNLFYIRKDNISIATAIFMGLGDYFHYHLAGSRKEYLQLSPNNLLLWEAIKYAKEHGFKKFHFGGGLTDSMDDSLFQFKRKFSKEYVDFYIGKRIHNQEVYRKLIEHWERKNGKKASILLQYRD